MERMNKIANRVSFLGMNSSFDLEEEIPGWVCLVVVSGWFRIGLSYPSLIADSYIESLQVVVHAALPLQSTIPMQARTAEFQSRRVLASVLTLLFFLCPLSAPLLFKQVLRSTSLAGLPFRLGLGRVMDAIGYSSGLLAPFASCPQSDALSFSR